MPVRKKSAAAGGNAEWAAQPTSGDWYAVANWNPAALPNDIATFGATNQANVTFSGSGASVQQIEFVDQAPAYKFTFTALDPATPPLIVSGAGCSNAGTTLQQFVVTAAAQKDVQTELRFTNTASAGGSNISYTAGPANAGAAGGGIIGFYNSSTAGSAIYTATTGSTPTKEPSTVGGSIEFNDTSNAGTATFTIYGTTGTDFDTFGNAAFHDSSSAANATFTNIGGTVNGGDGGNTQFFDSSTAASGLFHNYGATVSGANGGDVAFDGTATAGNGTFHNHPSVAAGGYGGVTSFNNNPTIMPANQGATAGNATIHNFGAKTTGQGGGHTSFSAVYGSPNGGEANIINHGSAVSGSSSAAGHTTFSIETPQTTRYVSSGGDATIWNLAGCVSGAPGGLTTFSVYGSGKSKPVGPNGPTGGNATIISVGAGVAGAGGGATLFEYWANAGNATLLASGGQSGGLGGSITFRDNASGGTALVALTGNATLDISGIVPSTLTLEQLSITGGTIVTNVGSPTIGLRLSNQLLINSGALNFSFYNKGVTPGQTYTILTAPNLASYTASQFTGNAIGSNAPQFSISGNNLQVTFGTSTKTPATKKPATKQSAMKLATKQPAMKLATKQPAVKQPAVKLTTKKPAVKLVTKKPAMKLATTKPATKKPANNKSSQRKKRSR